MSWPEVVTAKSEKRYEIILNGSRINEKLEENGLDLAIFDLTALNYLNINESKLKQLPDDVSKLCNLQTLVLHSNKIEKLPNVVGDLDKLKILDVSGNLLKELPVELGKLAQLTSLNASNNEIELLPSFVSNVKLSVLDLSNNKLKSFPDICHAELANVLDVKINGNLIEDIPSNINVLPSLKNLDVSKNKIKTLPGELVDCAKLKDINLKDNPISDRRLLKLIEQCRTKQILDYVKQHCPRINLNVAVEKGKKGKKGALTQKESEESESEIKRFRINIKHFTGDSLRVIVEENVKNVRPFIATCLVHDISFTEETFKKFIQLQTKLHDNICEKRNMATIATHDLKKLPVGSDLTYTAMSPKELSIKPLNRTTNMSGAELFQKLQTEAENLRKEKKRNVYSGIHKYLYLLEGKEKYPCLMNSLKEVISFPPITNSEITKIAFDTTSLLLEVTSASSQNLCKKIMDQLLKDMVFLFETDLSVQQVKNVDVDGNLKFVYPSRTDLVFEGIKNLEIVRE